MRKCSFLMVVLLYIVLVAGCGPSLVDDFKSDEVMGDQPEAKTNTREQQEPEEVAADDDWTIYELSITEEWKDLKVEVLALAIGYQVQSSYRDSPADAVALKFRIENTRSDGEGEFTIYPDQGTLITSTGEQVDPDFFESDHIGGEIYEGVIKDGSVLWFLERGNIRNLEWIRIKFNAYDEAADIMAGDWNYDFDIRIQIP